MDLSNQRQDYDLGEIDLESVDACPFRQFETWFSEASNAEILEPNAMILSTITPGTRPTQRTVLLKYFDLQGMVFFTNYGSRKASHIEHNAHVSLLFPWYGLQRQVEISGIAEKVTTAESIKYFALRPRGSQLGAWVSEQSTVISNKQLLIDKLASLKKRFASAEVPKPPGWGGFRVRPTRFEFWQGGLARLHDRIEYSRENSQDKSWKRCRLAP